MTEAIAIDDVDEAQCLGGTPLPCITFRNTSASSSSSSPSSTTSSSSKKRKTKQVNDGRLLNNTDWQFQDGIRSQNADTSRSRASTMSLAEAPSPKSIGSACLESPRLTPAPPARSYILIDSSTGETSRTRDTTTTLTNSSAGAGEKPAKTVLTTGRGSDPSLLAHRSTDNGQTAPNQLAIRTGSNVSIASKTSRTSSGLSSPPESRGVSFATYQAEISHGKARSPPRIGRLTLDETPTRVIELDNGERESIDSSGDDEAEDQDVRIVSASSRQPTPEQPGIASSPAGKHFGFIRGHKATNNVEEVQAKTTKSSMPPKRKREDAFADDIDTDHSSYKPPGSSSSSSPAGSDAGDPRAATREPPETIEIADDEDEPFVDEMDDADLSADEDDLPENPALLMGSLNRPIEVGDEIDPSMFPHDTYSDVSSRDFEDNDIEYIGSKRLTSSPRTSVVAASRRRSTVIPYRNQRIEYPLEDVGSITHRGWELKKGTFMEVSDIEGTATTYLLINHVIINHVTGAIKLRGHQFMRTRFVSGMLDRTRNEMCRMLEVDEDDPRPWMEQAQIEVSLEACMYAPREINITNRLFGKHGTCTFRPMREKKTGKEIEDRYLLACRWECVVFWPSAKHRVQGSCKGVPPKIFRLLKEDDSQLMGQNVRQSDDLIRDEWRGEGATVLGGSYIPGRDLLPQGFFRLKDGEVHKVHVNFDDREIFTTIESTFNIDLTRDREPSPPHYSNQSVKSHSHFSAHLTQTIDLTDPTPIPRSGSIRASVFSSSVRARLSLIANQIRGSVPLKRRPGQKYTYGDAFCGAGGATRGAHMAGLKVLWGFDKDTHACSSWHRNFPSAAIYEMDAQEICSSFSINLSCDILHMSPPCQYFSPAHTIAGKDDDMNSAALFACPVILRSCRPRIVTLEQTFGITNPNFALFFRAVVNMFTTNGYSITYKICQLHHWGLAQRRVRLIIIGAGPGEKLPMIPAYTHSEHGDARTGLLPYKSVRSCIASLRTGDPDHNLPNPTNKQSLKYRPWNGDSICPRAMTCAGGQNFHYDGTRGFTNREFAAIQGFPMEHRFGRMNVKKQIGNAVPPVIAKVLFEAVVKSLEEADEVEKEVVVLDE